MSAGRPGAPAKALNFRGKPARPGAAKFFEKNS